MRDVAIDSGPPSTPGLVGLNHCTAAVAGNPSWRSKRAISPSLRESQ